MPCVSTDRSPAPDGVRPLNVGAVSALPGWPPCVMGPFDHAVAACLAPDIIGGTEDGLTIGAWSGRDRTDALLCFVDQRRRALIAGLSVVVLTVAVLQTAVVPVLGIIADQLDASIVAVSWAVTANLLAAAAATPLIGRLADLHSKKRVLLIVLAVVLVGSVLAATTSSLALLILARVLQAASFALYPVGIAILREELAEDRMVSAMSVLSGNVGLRWRDRTGRRRPADEPRRQLPPRLLAHHRLHRPGHRHRGAGRARPAAQHDRDPSTGWAPRASRPDCRRSCWR